MSRRRNEAYVVAAQKAAKAIMLEEGYNAASYTAIANRCGIARTTVQHYFPAKEEFATEIMNRIAQVSGERAAEMVPEGEPPFVAYYLTSQICYGVFYLTEGTRQFLLDICSSRELQHAAAPDYLGTAFEQLSIASATDEDYFNLRYSIGGIFEIHYMYLRDGKQPDFAWLLSRTMKILARLCGISEAEFDRIVDSYTLDTDELFAIGRELIGLI